MLGISLSFVETVAVVVAGQAEFRDSHSSISKKNKRDRGGKADESEAVNVCAIGFLERLLLWSE